MAPRKKKPICKPKRRSRRIRKKSPVPVQAPCRVTKRRVNKCPYCGGAGRRVKKARNMNGRVIKNYFPMFFRHCCRNIRQQNIMQSGCISMIQAAECWRVLTCKQKEDFKKTVRAGGATCTRGSGTGTGNSGSGNKPNAGCSGPGSSGPGAGTSGNGSNPGHANLISWSSFCTDTNPSSSSKPPVQSNDDSHNSRCLSGGTIPTSEPSPDEEYPQTRYANKQSDNRIKSASGANLVLSESPFP